MSIHLEMVMQETLHDTSTFIGGRLINLRFADDIDLMGSSKGEIQYLTVRLMDRATTYGMEVSAGKKKKKSKIMTNSTNNISADTGING